MFYVTAIPLILFLLNGPCPDSVTEISGQSGNRDNWVCLQSAELAFEAEFPTTPVFSSGRKKFCWTAKDDSVTFLLEVSRVAGAVTASMIENALLPSLTGKSGKPEVKKGTQGSWPVYYFSSMEGDGNLAVKGYIRCDRNRLFIMRVSFPPRSSADHQRFFHSLELLDFDMTNPLPGQ